MNSAGSLLWRALALSAVAALVVVAAGAFEPNEEARSRLSSMSAEERSELALLLRQFDLSPMEQQEAIRQIDQRISRLVPSDQARYLATLRRYHNWLQSLPETARDNLQAKPPEERMAHIKTLLARHPVPKETNPPWMQFADVAGLPPFELAALFRIWQELTPDQKKEIDGLANGAARRAKLHDYGQELLMAREVRPRDFRVEEWIPKVEAKIAEIQIFDPELKSAVSKAESIAKGNKGKNAILKEVGGHTLTPLLRRLSINLYYLEQPPPRPVDPGRLAQFFAAMPPWIRSTFDSYTPDEARRRLTLVYRLLYPKDEFRPVRADARPKAAPPRPAGSASPPPPAAASPSDRPQG
jgi:hypothetical protein